jgi:hypothetical protein
MFIFLSFLDSKSNLCRQFVFYEKNAIPHPAIPDCTNSLFGVEVIWEAEFDPTRFVQGLQVFRAELLTDYGGSDLST